MAPELGMQTVPSLNITYTEEKVGGCCVGRAARWRRRGVGADTTATLCRPPPTRAPPAPACLQGYVTADVAEKEGLHKLNLSGTKFRKMLRGGEDIPECERWWRMSVPCRGRES